MQQECLLCVFIKRKTAHIRKTRSVCVRQSVPSQKMRCTPFMWKWKVTGAFRRWLTAKAAVLCRSPGWFLRSCRWSCRAFFGSANVCSWQLLNGHKCSNWKGGNVPSVKDWFNPSQSPGTPDRPRLCKYSKLWIYATSGKGKRMRKFLCSLNREGFMGSVKEYPEFRCRQVKWWRGNAIWIRQVEQNKLWKRKKFWKPRWITTA